MELIIVNAFTKEEKRIKNAKFIPRIGEQVIWDYEPSPKVTHVGYNFDDDKVFIIIE